jgi:hypothetical protein
MIASLNRDVVSENSAVKWRDRCPSCTMNTTPQRRIHEPTGRNLRHF